MKPELRLVVVAGEPGRAVEHHFSAAGVAGVRVARLPAPPRERLVVLAVRPVLPRREPVRPVAPVRVPVAVVRRGLKTQ